MEWQHRIKFPRIPWYEAEDESPEQTARCIKAFVPVLRRFAAATTHGPSISRIAARFEKAKSQNTFNNAMAELYDYADTHSIWIEPWIDHGAKVEAEAVPEAAQEVSA